MRRGRFAYWLGVDGGGSGTRATVFDADGRALARGCAGPSGLALGTAAAWQAVDAAIDAAFASAARPRPPRCTLALGVGVAGASHEPWAAAFRQTQPGFGALAVDSDAITTLLGAHGGRPGSVVAIGTGSVGAALLPDGRTRVVGGWGFPAGDEGSGAWLGLRALAHLQRVVDGRLPGSDFASALFEACGGSRQALANWVASADQTRCASLAPLVIAHAATDAVAQGLVERGCSHLCRLATTLDPGHAWPLALCGGLAEPLQPWLPARLRERSRPPLGDATHGGWQLITAALQAPPLAPLTGQGHWSTA